jgi:hypothetical protein
VKKILILLFLSFGLDGMEEKYSEKYADLCGMEEFAILLENNCEKPGSPVWKEEDQKNLTHRSQPAIDDNNAEHLFMVRFAARAQVACSFLCSTKFWI